MHYVLGKRGYGKTSYLTSLFAEHLYEGVAYFDFTGDVTRQLEQIPPERWDDTILFLPADTEYPPGFNILHNSPPDTPTYVTNTTKAAWHYEGSTPLLDLYTYTTSSALRESTDGTLLGVPYLLTNTAYRSKIISQIKDPVLKSFWCDFYDNLSDKDKRQDTASTLNKFYALLTDSTIRNIIGQKHSSFTVKDTSVIVASFPPTLGREKSSFLATLLLYHLPDIFTIIDDGFHLAPQAVLSKRNIVFSHEYLAQVTKSLQDTLIGTADTFTVFQLGPADDKRLRLEFDINRNVSELKDLAYLRYHQKSRGVVYDQAVHIFEPVSDPSALMKQSRRTTRAQVEASINKFLNSMVSTNETKTRSHSKRNGHRDKDNGFLP
jgi:hypothetical protein